MNKKPLLNLALTLCLSLSIASCGGGGGGGNNTQENNDVTVSWEAPTTREDDSALSKSEIQGYVIVYIEKDELENLEEDFFNSNFSKKEFIENPNISKYLPSYTLSTLIENGQPNIIISNFSETEYTLLNVDPGTHYFAVSAYDYDYIYSRLSKTKSITIK